jgi:flagellar assembly protein FliH
MSERPTAARVIERWLPPKVEGVHPGGRREERAAAGPAAKSPGAQQAEAAGYAAGLARAQAEQQPRLAQLNAQIERFTALLSELAEPLRLLDAEMERALLSLALAIGSQLARRTLRQEPAQIIAIVRECLKQLPLASRDVRVRLHPEDAAVVRAQLAPVAGEHAWTLIDDATLTRGGCRIESEHSQLDARFESRLQALVASALGDERSVERAAPPAPGTSP